MNPNDVLRRCRLLQTTAVVGAATLAGCSVLGDRGATTTGEGGGDGEDADEPSTTAGTDHPTRRPCR